MAEQLEKLRPQLHEEPGETPAPRKVEEHNNATLTAMVQQAVAAALAARDAVAAPTVMPGVHAIPPRKMTPAEALEVAREHRDYSTPFSTFIKKAKVGDRFVHFGMKLIGQAEIERILENAGVKEKRKYVSERCALLSGNWSDPKAECVTVVTRTE